MNNFYISIIKHKVVYQNLFNIINIIYDFLTNGSNIYFHSSEYLKEYLSILNGNLFSYYFLETNSIYFNFNSAWLRQKTFKYNFKNFLKKKKFDLIFLYDLNYYKLNHAFFKSLSKPVIGFQSINTLNNLFTYSIICNTNQILNYFLIYLTINKLYMLSLLNRQRIFFYY